MSNGVRYTPTFALPSEYEQQAMEARRRRRMAEMLAAQAYQPQEGGVAPIPSAAPLVQGLQAFFTARQLKKAEEAEEKAQQADIEGFRKLREELGPRSQIAAPTAADIAGSVGMPQISEDGTVSYGQTTMPKLGMESVMPTAEERERTLENALFTSSPTARKYAELMMARKPDVEEFYAPTETKTGLVQFGKRGGIRETKFEAAPKETAPTTLARLQAERAALPPGDPRIALYDKAIQSEIGSKAPITKIDLGEKGDVKAQELFLTEISKVRPQAQAATSIIKSVNNLDKLTKKGTFVGSLAPTAVGASQFLKGFGINVSPETLANTEAFQAQVSDLTLSMQSALGGARGFTEKETEMLKLMFPQIVNSPEARMAIAEIIRNKQLQIIDDYDSLINDYQATYPTSRIPYKKVDDEEVRYQRWKRQQMGTP